jgi:hypothetical protein
MTTPTGSNGTPCARNLPQHFNGCACTAVPGAATAEADVDLTGARMPATDVPDAAVLKFSGGEVKFAPVDDSDTIGWEWNGFVDHDKVQAAITEHDLASVHLTRMPTGGHGRWDNHEGETAIYTFRTEAEATDFAERVTGTDILDGYAEFDAEDIDPTGDADCIWFTTAEVSAPPSQRSTGDDLDVEADFARAMLTDADQAAAPKADPVLEEWRHTPGYVVMFEDLPKGTPEGWQGASVMSANGTRWNLRYIPKGSRTGHNMRAIATQDMIGFYDAGHVTEDWPHGQKVADYYVDTLMPTNGPGVASGLNLHGGEPAWQIDAESMRGVLGWAQMARS